jgi:hypothetical protein
VEEKPQNRTSDKKHQTFYAEYFATSEWSVGIKLYIRRRSLFLMA